MSHLVHIIKKDHMCEGVLNILCFCFPFIELFIWNDLFKLLQGYHSNILDPKKCYDYKKAMSLEEVDLQYVTIRSWWYSFRVANEGTIHKFNN